MKQSSARKPEPSLQWCVADLVRQYPETSAVFTRFRMACVGCVMARFETLGEAAAAYGLDSASFLKDVRGEIIR